MREGSAWCAMPVELRQERADGLAGRRSGNRRANRSRFPGPRKPPRGGCDADRSGCVTCAAPAPGIRRRRRPPRHQGISSQTSSPSSSHRSSTWRRLLIVGQADEVGADVFDKLKFPADYVLGHGGGQAGVVFMALRAAQEELFSIQAENAMRREFEPAQAKPLFDAMLPMCGLERNGAAVEVRGFRRPQRGSGDRKGRYFPRAAPRRKRLGGNVNFAAGGIGDADFKVQVFFPARWIPQPRAHRNGRLAGGNAAYRREPAPARWRGHTPG